tara:strand:+ start:1121 stop:2029 length:909 start_codon:yes stop_codon:yes gene_type:complete
MYFYWGAKDSGKGHLMHLARINNKTFLGGRLAQIFKEKTITHIIEKQWRDITSQKTIYHNINGFRKCTKIEDKIFSIKVFGKHNSTINPDRIREPHYQDRMRKQPFTQDDIKKYTQEKYINTNVYYEIINKCDYITTDLNADVLKGHYDEIFDGVDIVTFPDCSNIPNDIIDGMIPSIKDAIHIVPYKSNVLDSIISKLDFDFIKNTSIFDVPKEQIWNWLDSFILANDKILSILNQYKLPYTLFDLDNGDYRETFGGLGDKELPRDFTHPRGSWDVDNNPNYAKIVEIAKEYCSLRNLTKC